MVLNTGPWLTSARKLGVLPNSKCGGCNAKRLESATWSVAAQRVLLESLRGSKARAGSSFSYRGGSAPKSKSDRPHRGFRPKPQLYDAPRRGSEPSRRRAGVECAEVVRSALLQAKTRRVQDLIFRDVSANSPVFVAKGRAVRGGIRNSTLDF